jgi:Bacterial extracellular solute-binding proteins, family 5 Middle
VALRGTAAALVFLLAACGGTGDDRADEIVFRVGATAGLSELLPTPATAGSAAAAIDLVFDFADAHVEDQRVDGNRIVLRRLSRSPLTADELASAIWAQGLVSARALGPDRIEAVFDDAASAAASVQPFGLAFRVGPFRVESQRRGRVRLHRQGRSAIDVIEIVEVSSSDEWRKFMARELDVMSSSPNLYRDEFAGMGSVRLLDIPATTSAALFFNVRYPALADARVRRRIASGLNRPAIARVASGDASSAAAPVAGAPEAEVAMPARLSLLVLKDDSTLLLAASVLRHQLDRLHIAIDVKPLSLEEFIATTTQGRQQLVLLPLPNGNRRYGRFLSPGPDTPTHTAFADAEYDAAVGRGDFAAAQAILDRELPATALYERRSFAAVDARFCGDVTPSDISWRWMAALHLCQNEEAEGEGVATP